MRSCVLGCVCVGEPSSSRRSAACSKHTCSAACVLGSLVVARLNLANLCTLSATPIDFYTARRLLFVLVRRTQTEMHAGSCVLA